MDNQRSRSTYHPTNLEKTAGHQRVRCTGMTKRGMQCRQWSIAGSDRCHIHQHGDAEVEPGSAQTSLPSTLPGVTQTQVYENEKVIKRQIDRRKAAAARKAARDEAKAIKDANKNTLAVVKATGLEVVGDVRLRTMEDCLLLIEYAVEEILDQPPSINKSKTFIMAARTAGQLIIQAGIADKAVEWFQQNVKLVAGIDLEQI